MEGLPCQKDLAKSDDPIFSQLSHTQLKFVAPKFICQDFQCGRI